MQTRNAWLFFILTALLLAVILVIFWYSKSYTTFKTEEIDFTVSREYEVSRIEMLSFADSSLVELEKNENNRWMLNSVLFANELAVKELLSVLSKIIVWQPVSLASRDSINSQLDSEGTLVNIFIHTHRIRFGNVRLFPHQILYQSFVVGDDAPDGESTYMRKHTSNQAFFVKIPGFDTGISYVFESNEKSWRDPVVIDTEWDDIANISVYVTDDVSESFMVKNEPDRTFAFYDWENPNQEIHGNLDTILVLRYLSSFNEIYYESLLDDEAEKVRKETIREQPFIQLTVELKDGKQTRIDAYARKNLIDSLKTDAKVLNDPNRFYIRINEDEYAIAQYYTFNRILRPLSFFKK
jgi:hypothetical protein